jgi:hypothetical protein
MAAHNLNKDYRISLTIGDAGENHVGMEMVGKKQDRGTGFTTDDLDLIETYMTKELKLEVEYHSLNIKGSEDAAILIIRDYLDLQEQTDIQQEMESFEWDKKYYDTRRKKVLNKIARSNCVFSTFSQEPDYEAGKGRIVKEETLPQFYEAKTNLLEHISEALSIDEDDEIEYITEGNKYDGKKKKSKTPDEDKVCGIGYHGDAERTRVICISIGSDNYPMNWHWFLGATPIGEPFEFLLNSGDVYIMSEKATGNDWKKRSIYTLRHAAGAKKYLDLSKKKTAT